MLLEYVVYSDPVQDKQKNNDSLSFCQAKDIAAAHHNEPKTFSAEELDNTEISADFTRSSNDGITSLDGNVIIEKHLLRVSADHAHYDKQQEELEVSGNVHIDTERLSLDADSVRAVSAWRFMKSSSFQSSVIIKTGPMRRLFRFSFAA